MKSLIVFAVAIHLVSVQGSEIIQEDLDYELMHDDGRDYISVDGSDAILDERKLEELQGMELADEVCQYEGAKHLKCEGKTCKTCEASLCIGLTHYPQTRQFKVHITYRHHNLYDKIIQAKDWTHCKKVGIFDSSTTWCLTLSNVQEEYGKVCLNVAFGISLAQRVVEYICI